MSERTRNVLITVIKFSISISILVYLFNTARNDDQFELMFDTPKRWGWIATGLVACLLAHLIGFVRWQLMVRALGLPFSLLDALRIGFIGLFFNLVAFGVIGGDTLRAYYVTRQVKGRVPEAISSVVADRLIGILTMFSVASIAFLLFDSSRLAIDHSEEFAGIRNVGRGVWFLTIVGYLGLIGLYCSPWLTHHRWYQSVMRLPRIGGILMRLMAVVTIYRSRPGAVGLGFLLSIGVNFCFAISIYSLAVGITTVHPSFLNHFVIEPIVMVSNAAPVPGGIGGMELAMKFLYQAFSYETGVVVAFAFRLALLSVSAIGGAFWLMNRSKMKEMAESTAGELDR